MIRVRTPVALPRLTRGIFLPAGLFSICGPLILGELVPQPAAGLSIALGLLFVLLVYCEHVLAPRLPLVPAGRADGNHDFVPKRVRHAWHDAEAAFWRHVPSDLADHARAELEAAGSAMRRALYGGDR
ncbi:hypothetical protein [Xanthobacter flavus]|uniref:hypothetical protein n=1 Tax=Xanthobacter flavus TaxID=281 RepID=UPI003726EF10